MNLNENDTSKIIKWVRETDPSSLPYGVVGLGWGPKIVDGLETGEYSVICSVLEKKSIKDLGSNVSIPKTLNVEGISVKTDVVQTTVYSTLLTDCYPNQPTEFNPTGVVANNRKKHRPLKGGCSSIGTRGSDATLGILVRDKSDGQVVGLSNSHVYAGCQLVSDYFNVANDQRSTNILNISSVQPALSCYYGGYILPELYTVNTLPEDQTFFRMNPYGSLNPYENFIGMCKRTVLIGNRGSVKPTTDFLLGALKPITSCDAAIISLSSYDLITPDSANIIGFNASAPFKFATDEEIDSLLVPSSPNFGSPVFRSGRTCGPIGFPGNTQSCSLSVYQFSDEFVGSYCGYTSLFEDSFRVRGNVVPGRGGDSGSAMFALLSSNMPSASAWKVIGLLFAGPGAEFPQFTIGCRITEVAKGLDIIPWDTKIPILTAQQEIKTLTDVFSNTLVLSGRKYFQVGKEELENWKLQSENLNLGETIFHSGNNAIEMSRDGSTLLINNYLSAGQFASFAVSNNEINFYGKGNSKVFRKINNNWTQLGSTLSAFKETDSLDLGFGYFSSINESGNTVAIICMAQNAVFIEGEEGEYFEGFKLSRVYTFEFNGNDWIKKGQYIDTPQIYQGNIDTFSNPLFVWQSVVLSDDGNTMALSMRGPADPENSKIQPAFSYGMAQVYSYNNAISSWVQKGQTIYGAGNNNQLGTSISLNGDGNILVVSEPNYWENTPVQGRVKTFQYNGSFWERKGQDILGDISYEGFSQLGSSGFNSGNNFGYSKGVNLNKAGNVLAVGSVFNSQRSYQFEGYVDVFEFKDNIWTRKGRRIYGGDNWTALGYIVKLNDEGNILVVTGRGIRFNGFINIYEFENGTWNLKQTFNKDSVGFSNSRTSFTPSYYGCSFAIDGTGNTLLIGNQPSESNSLGFNKLKLYTKQ